jgi:NCS2 family nucleobase:cation symporter-2
VVILGKAQGTITSSPISFSLIALGLATLLQALKKGPIGSGYLAPPVISAIYFPASMAAVVQGGLGLVYGMTIFAGFVEIFFSFFLNLLRKYFPPLVCGLIILAVGFQLGLLAISQILSVKGYQESHFKLHLLASVATLLTMVILTIWAKGMWRLLSPFIGVVAGFIISCFLSIIPSFEEVLSASWVALPSISGISYNFSTNLILPFILAAIASSLRVVGGVTTSQKINHSNWARPDIKNIQKGIYADGVGCLIGGFLGAPGLNMAPSMVGVAQATGATSRVIAYSLAAWLIVLAFLPKFIYLFLAIPLAVMGSALLFTASFMIAGGIDLITTRKIDTRAILIIGISLLLGLSHEVIPTFYSGLPAYLQMFTNSLLSIVTLTAFLLNLFFRIKIRQNLCYDDKQIVEQGKEWKLSPAIIERIRKSASGLYDQISRGYLKEGDIQLSLIYDPIEIVLKCSYQGTLPKLRFDIDKDKEMIEETSFTLGLANYLSEIAPDEIKTSAKNAFCIIDLYFHI